MHTQTGANNMYCFLIHFYIEQLSIYLCLRLQGYLLFSLKWAQLVLFGYIMYM